MKEKEDLRIRKTRATLYKSLSQLLKAKSFEKISITDICKQAKINRSTFYQHYQDKNSLLQDVIKDTLQDLEKQLSSLKKSSSRKEDYLKIMELILYYLEENLTLLTLFPNNEDIFSLIEKIANRKYEEILEKRQNSSSHISNQEIATFYIAGGVRLIEKSLKEESTFKIKKILSQLKELLPEAI